LALKIYKANIDGSGGVDQPVLVLAGYVATVEQWLPFTDDWDGWLKVTGKPFVKMSEMVSGPEIAASFYRITEQHVSAGIAFAVPIEPLVKVCDELGFPPDSPIRNPYYLASKGIINCTAQYQHELGIKEPIDFIFDSQTEQEKVRQAWDAYVNGQITTEVRALTGEKPLFLDDKKHPPLQAADIYAWWLREAWEKGGMDAFLHKWPFPWKINRDFRRFLMALDEGDIRTELTKLRQLMIEAGAWPGPRYQLTVKFGGLMR
jgi:Protein of unknown function (DUF3800)